MRPDVKEALDGIRSQVSDLQASSTGWLDSVLTRRIIVHMTNNQSVEGSLVEVMSDGIVLRAAKLLNDEGSPTPMAGETWVARDKVAFAQLDE